MIARNKRQLRQLRQLLASRSKITYLLFVLPMRLRRTLRLRVLSDASRLAVGKPSCIALARLCGTLREADARLR
ncbi:hypothetical protein [Scytonema sp. HK-05]|uniref:hypothetical protein n=1 Tax=Scytonema sp. HK-05 TaxID=1137095 RepID=UPI00116125D6|nr:hypothetical protein [Scytonema sp. HK-05]